MKKLFTTTVLFCILMFQCVLAQENTALGDWEGKAFMFEFDVECDCSPIQKDSLKTEFKPILEEGLDLAVIISDLFFDKDMHVTGSLMYEDIDGSYYIEGDSIVIQNDTKSFVFERSTDKTIPQIKFYTTEVKENPSTIMIDGIGDVTIQPISFSLILEKEVY